MSTVHRILLSALGRSGRPVTGRAAGVGAGTGEGSPQSMGSAVLTCAPWAGLYVEGLAAS
ncbi:MAG TPA: hypothetical protein VJS86_03055 [Arthrobacter sp.]|nr:hypothetical protein [Arthrobacter sp.]